MSITWELDCTIPGNAVAAIRTLATDKIFSKLETTLSGEQLTCPVAEGQSKPYPPSIDVHQPGQAQSSSLRPQLDGVTLTAP